MAPFAANYAFELYDCAVGAVVGLLHNEEAIGWPAQANCLKGIENSTSEHTTFCPLETVRTFYQSSITCSYDNLCNTPTAAVASTVTASAELEYAFGAFACGVLVTGVLAYFKYRSKNDQLYDARYQRTN